MIHKQDANKFRVRFFWHEGKKKDYVELKQPANPYLIKAKPVDEHIVELFPMEWRAYKEQAETVPIQGTPLSEIGLDLNTAERYKFKGVRTVEELAEVGEYSASVLGSGSLGHINMAKMHLKNKELEEMLEAKTSPKRRPREGLIGEPA